MAEASEAARRRRAATWLSVTAVVAMIIGVVATLFVKSPQRIAAETQPPPRTAITALLEKRVISRHVVLNGTIRPENSTTIRLVTATANAQDVVGDLPVQQGSQVRAGERIATISGRPIIVIPGRLPAYRNLKPGSTGEDVAQLQAGLRAVGLPVEDPDRSYGVQTRKAVADLYAKAGFAPIEEGGDEVAGAEASLEALRRQRDDSRLALARLQRDQRAANAQQKPEEGGVQAADAVADAKRALDRIQQDYGKAQAALQTARDQQGATVPLGEIVFVPELPAVVSEVRAAVGQPAAASQLTVASGPLAVHSELSGQQAGEVRPEQPATVISSDASQFEATVGPLTIAVAPTTAGGSEPGTGSSGAAASDATTYRVTLRPRTPLPTETENQLTRVSIAVASTPEEVLVAPSAAVSTAADGSAQLTLPGMPPRPVRVGLGFVGDGYVEVTPEGDVSLSAGDAVMIGWSG